MSDQEHVEQLAATLGLGIADLTKLLALFRQYGETIKQLIAQYGETIKQLIAFYNDHKDEIQELLALAKMLFEALRKIVPSVGGSVTVTPSEPARPVF